MPPRDWTFLNRSPCHGIKKVASLLHFILKWQGMRESNSQQWFWRPLLYHLTNPLYLTNTLNLLHIHLSNERIWRPLLYHLTNPLYLTNTLNLLHIHLSNERIWRPLLYHLTNPLKFK